MRPNHFCAVTMSMLLELKHQSPSTLCVRRYGEGAALEIYLNHKFLLLQERLNYKIMLMM